MTELHFEIPGNPVPLERHRMGRGKAYDTVRNKETKRDIGLLARRTMGNKPPLDGPLCASVTFAYEKLKSRPDQRFKTSRADLDNLLKMVFDALNGVAYHDDAQVVRIYAEKVYADEPGTDVKLFPIETKSN